MRIGLIIQNYRKKNAMSMEAFAQKSGLSKAYVGMLEQGIHPKTKKPIHPSIDTIKRVAIGIGTDFDTLFRSLDEDVSLNNDYEITIADRIKNKRESLNISQEELASKLGLKDKSSISKIEASGDKISLKNIEKISVALNCSIQSLMGWEDDRKIGHIMRYVEEFDPETKKMIELFQNSSPEMRNAAIAVLKSGQQNHEPDG